MNKDGKITANRVSGLIIAIVMVTVLLSVAASVIPTGSQAFYDFTAAMTNTTVLGTGAVSLAGDMPGWVGYFWVLGPFILVVSLILGLFMYSKRRR